MDGDGYGVGLEGQREVLDIVCCFLPRASVEVRSSCDGQLIVCEDVYIASV
jgi:hypothetical protein